MASTKTVEVSHGLKPAPTSRTRENQKSEHKTGHHNEKESVNYSFKVYEVGNGLVRMKEGNLLQNCEL